MPKEKSMATTTVSASIGIGVLILYAILGVSFVVKDNQVAQIFFGVLVALVTTLVSVWASMRYSKAQAQDVLTRYGLQAWRNLDSLAVKVSEQLGSEVLAEGTLQAWLLDIDQAKWAWQDLLREVFELQARLERERDEMVACFREKMASTEDPQARISLESAQSVAMARLASQARLPIRLPVEVPCKNCGAVVSAALGPSPSDTAWPTCPSCHLRFPIHRKANGEVQIGGIDKRISTQVNCPECERQISWDIPEGHSVQFEQPCPSCETILQFTGNASRHRVESLGSENTMFVCPHCHEESPVWVSPTRQVKFIAKCKNCDESVQIEGTQDDFRAILLPVTLRDPRL